MNNIITLDILTNQELKIEKKIHAFKLHSLEIDNINDINDIESLQIIGGGALLWDIPLKILLFNSLIEDNNIIVFSKDLLFKNDDYVYNLLFSWHDTYIKVNSKNLINCKIFLLEKKFDANYISHPRRLISKINNYSYQYINNKNKIDCLYESYFGKLSYDYFENINKIYLKGSKINKIDFNGNVNYEIIKKNIILTNENIRIIKTIKSLNLIKDIENIILSYCNIYEYLYKLDIKTNSENIRCPITFDKNFNGEILIFRDGELHIDYGMVMRTGGLYLDVIRNF